jgi:pSer/pThr/pTyr-binding forkhead associated (FHA) protein
VTTIGRSLDNDVVLAEAEVSRHHARIEYRNGAFEIVDLGSTNGTRVNGAPVARARLQDGDVIGLGMARLEFGPYGRFQP